MVNNMTIAERASISCVLVVLCVTASAEAQTSIPTCVVQGVQAGGPIFTGSIVNRLPASQDAPMGSVTINVDRYLRGAHFSSNSLTLPVDWTKGPSKPWILRPPIWHEATLEMGERLLLVLFEENNERAAVCVLDLDAHSALLPAVEQMVALNSTEGNSKVARMEQALSDPSPAIRAMSIE